MRTLLDLAATAPDRIDRAVNEAYARNLVRPGELRPTAGRRGARALGEVLADRPGFTRWTAERVLIGLIVRAGLPRPEANVPIGRYEADFLWPEHRLVVEVDGDAAHAGRRAFERDHRKDAALKAAGYEVLRFTYRQLTAEPERTVATLTTVLLRRGRS